MSATTAAPPANAGDVVLVLRPVADPLARTNGGYARDASYRLRLLLKRMLRDHGFRCLSVGPATPHGQGDAGVAAATG